MLFTGTRMGRASATCGGDTPKRRHQSRDSSTIKRPVEPTIQMNRESVFKGLATPHSAPYTSAKAWQRTSTNSRGAMPPPLLGGRNS